MSTIYLEGGGDSAQLRIRCREGFRKLLEKSGFVGRMPRLVACGSRQTAFGRFNTAFLAKVDGEYVALLIDSEDPMTNINQTWDHLAIRDGWARPIGAADDQVLMITTCMETWIIVDRSTLEQHYGRHLRVSALPSLSNIESRDRHEIQAKLATATSPCPNAYTKNKRSFEILAKLNPDVLKRHLPSFARALQILNDKA